MRKKLVLLLSMLFIVVIVGCGSNQVSGNQYTPAEEEDVIKGEDNQNTSDVVESENEESEIQEETDKEDADDEIQNEDTTYNIGDSTALKEWTITVTDFQIVESIAGGFGSFSPEEEGNQYAQVFVTVVNDGKSADTFLPSYGFGDDVNAKLLFGDGYEFSATNLLGYDNELHDTHVNPLSSGSGEIAFNIPETVVNSQDEILIQFKSGNDTVYFKVR